MKFSEAVLSLPASETITEQVRLALAEDLGDGDRTAALIPQDAASQVQVVCREDAVLCGTAWFNEVCIKTATRSG